MPKKNLMKSFNKSAILILILVFSLAACKKETKCDNARICVKNIGTDVIWYAWGSNQFSDSIAPGEEACNYVGPIGDGHTYITNFQSDHGSYSMEVTECDQKHEIK